MSTSLTKKSSWQISKKESMDCNNDWQKKKLKKRWKTLMKQKELFYVQQQVSKKTDRQRQLYKQFIPLLSKM